VLARPVGRALLDLARRSAVRRLTPAESSALGATIERLEVEAGIRRRTGALAGGVWS
jgi:hypothetical protein